MPQPGTPRYSQREWIGPKVDSDLYKRHTDWYKFDSKDTAKLYPRREFNKEDPRNIDSVRKPDGSGFEEVPSDPFYYNSRNLSKFYAALKEDPLYPGMFEGIGKILIYTAQYLENPFARFVKDPFQFGGASLSGMFKEVKSHDWDVSGFGNIGSKKSKKYGVKVTGVDTGDVRKITSEDKTKIYNFEETPNSKNPLFAGETPELLTDVSYMNYSREISLKVNAKEFAQYCLTPEMVTQTGAALMSLSHASYMNDMFTASKHYFCGIVRAGDWKTSTDYGTASSTGDAPNFSNPMLTRVKASAKKWDENREEAGYKLAAGVGRIIDTTVECDFKTFSDKYNPMHADRISENCTIVLDRHYYYDIDKKYYADLNHPEYVKLHESTIWVDEFPQLGTAIFADKTHPKDNHCYKLIGMIVDDNAPSIIPYKEPVSVQEFFNPQEESVTFFTHYQCDFEFKNFMNRRYIYLDMDLS